MQIITRRFLLREFTGDDGPALCAYHADPRYAEFYPPEELGPDHARQLLLRFMQWSTERPRRNYQFAIVHLRNPQGLLGCCGLRGEGFDADQAELGIELAPSHWGRYGYAIEVASAMLDFGFRDLCLQEVRGFSNSANTLVTRLAYRYGAVKIGVRPGPGWMSARGWSQTEWRLTRKRYETHKPGLEPCEPPQAGDEGRLASSASRFNHPDVQRREEPIGRRNVVKDLQPDLTAAEDETT
jgi:ribosomal-protein-alanine N-acetyltransferase